MHPTSYPKIRLSAVQMDNSSSQDQELSPLRPSTKLSTTTWHVSLRTVLDKVQDHGQQHCRPPLVEFLVLHQNS